MCNDRHAEPEHRLFLAFGSNAGRSAEIVDAALDEAEAAIGSLIRKTPPFQSEPWGHRPQAWFLNLIAEYRTQLRPLDCLHRCRAIEDRHGRVRTQTRYAPRTLDIDLLFYDQLVLDDDELTLPHPRIAQRRFILLPMNGLWPALRHPREHATIAELLKRCTDPLAVRPYPPATGEQETRSDRER